jgi:succinate dehydrogenase / fumarate reductase membrane anchor subunit
VVLIGIVVTLVGRSHATVLATLSKPLVAVLLVAAMISVAIHMRLGMQIIIEDYVHSEFRKVVLLMLNTFFAWGIGLCSIYAVLMISFGS